LQYVGGQSHAEVTQQAHWYNPEEFVGQIFQASFYMQSGHSQLLHILLGQLISVLLQITRHTSLFCGRQLQNLPALIASIIILQKVRAARVVTAYHLVTARQRTNRK